MANDESGGAGTPGEEREFRVAELAEAAGITVRTLRFYRERKLVPPPRREGRIAWYNGHHLARLRTIAALLDRGHTLGGIAELLSAFECGRDVGDLLGLSGAIAAPWSRESPVRLTSDALAGHFPGEDTEENLTAALDLGYLAVDGDDLVHTSRRLLDASTALVRNGVPLSAVIAAGREVRTHADALADTFTTLVRRHVLADVLAHAASGAPLPPAEIARVTEALDQLRPIVKTVVDAEISMAMDRRVRAELETWPAPAPPPPPD
ncbi:MerR family transcriptional regulator [Streptomyces netropsis]|uniref:DNA-binding transcriptional MerR regulator n=1 Tax=Streptomyces netropsis TaxID=55404 RepID=A0A7W7LBK0_STRNE|nr:MerR family transcriptional regulator [Streptomyces netropsis]MBB4887002.1 DNA-binding transcriptional MerR regulator [Streptomyces netropsis]GGR24819.1 MerR family transcriptional regulator [Streptomyces netropsis]